MGRVRIVDEGGMEVAIDAMRSCQARGPFAHRAEGRARIDAAEGVEVAIEAMRKHPNDPFSTGALER